MIIWIGIMMRVFGVKIMCQIAGMIMIRVFGVKIMCQIAGRIMMKNMEDMINSKESHLTDEINLYFYKIDYLYTFVEKNCQ